MGRRKEIGESKTLDFISESIKKDYGASLATYSWDEQLMITKNFITNLDGAIEFIRKFKPLPQPPKQ